MWRGSIISHEQLMNLENRIHCPEQLGINQGWIDEYDAFITDYYNGYAKSDDCIKDAIKSQIIEDKYKYENSILIPL